MLRRRTGPAPRSEALSVRTVAPPDTPPWLPPVQYGRGHSHQDRHSCARECLTTVGRYRALDNVTPNTLPQRSSPGLSLFLKTGAPQAVPISLVLILAVLIGGGFAGVAHALNNPDNMVPANANGAGGQTGSCAKGQLGNARPCQTDNRDVYWYVEKGTYSTHALETNDIDVVKSVIRGKYDANTDLIEHRHLTSQVKFSGSGETDIIYQEGPVPSTFDGYTWCDDPNDGTYKCDQQYIRIEPGKYDSGLTCHETGHAVGLVHGQDSSPNLPNFNEAMKCMKTPVPSNENLGSNNQDNIDDTY